MKHNNYLSSKSGSNVHFFLPLSVLQPMMSSVSFAVDPDYRAREFTTTPEDRPLVAHFSGNDPATMLAAAKVSH